MDDLTELKARVMNLEKLVQLLQSATTPSLTLEMKVSSVDAKIDNLIRQITNLTSAITAGRRENDGQWVAANVRADRLEQTLSTAIVTIKAMIDTRIEQQTIAISEVLRESIGELREYVAHELSSLKSLH